MSGNTIDRLCFYSINEEREKKATKTNKNNNRKLTCNSHMCIIHFTSLRILQWIGTSYALTGCSEQFLWTTTCVDSLFLLHFFFFFFLLRDKPKQKRLQRIYLLHRHCRFSPSVHFKQLLSFYAKISPKFFVLSFAIFFLFWLHTTQPRMRHTHKKLHKKHSNSNLFQYFVQISSADSNTCFAIVISVFLPVNCYFHLKKKWKHLTIDWLMFFTPRLLPLLLHSYFIW